MRLTAFLCYALLFALNAPCQTPPAPAAATSGPDQDVEAVLKSIDDVQWRLVLGDIAEVDKVQYTSLPPQRVQNPDEPGAKNPLIISAYTFIPKNLDRGRKQPLMIYAHGGVHANFSSKQSAHIVRELIVQGYSIIAPDYRGSTGYGRGFYEQIDYGGREVDDADAAREWMLDAYPFLDPKRVGMIGWSHGGMITLLNVFEHPNDYAVAYAGVPVSDLVARLGYQTEHYRKLFSAPYHIGKTVREDIPEYRKRSPVAHAAELKTNASASANWSAADPHEYQRRGCKRSRSREPDCGTQGGGQAVRIQDLPGRPRRPHVQPA
jgi:pimeloyl-ACP methyl ester carboxylesterase